MAETAGTAGPIVADSPVTSDDIAAFASAESASSADTPTDAAAPAPATEEPATSGSTVPETPSGPIPFDRHKAILERARTEARTAAEQEYRQKFGWAERYQPEQVEQGTRLYQWLNQNPVAFQSWLQSQLGPLQSQGAGQAAQDEPPPPDLRAEDGTPVYSAPQLQKFMEWKERQFQQRITPLERKFQGLEEKDRLRSVAMEAKVQAGDLLKQARETWPLFADLQPHVLQAMQADPRLDFHQAYIQVFREHGLEQARKKWETEYQGTLARKADASTPPPGTRAGTPKKYTEMDVLELVKQEHEALSRKR